MGRAAKSMERIGTRSVDCCMSLDEDLMMGAVLRDGAVQDCPIRGE